MKSNVVLIGFMGTGKSSIGRKLAKVLNKTFIDTDQEIEKITGLSIPNIFKKHGEIRFRSEEKLMVKKVATMENCVISTGGGVVLAPENMEELSKKGWIISLTATPEVIFGRVSKRNTRPLLRKNKSVAYIAELMKKRAPFYSCADMMLDTSTADVGVIITKIIQFLKEQKENEPN